MKENPICGISPYVSGYPPNIFILAINNKYLAIYVEIPFFRLI